MGLLLLIIVLVFRLAVCPCLRYHSYGYGPLGCRWGAGACSRRGAAPQRPTLTGHRPWPCRALEPATAGPSWRRCHPSRAAHLEIA